MKQKVISICFLAVFAIQIFPIQQKGNLLSGHHFIEELPLDVNPENGIIQFPILQNDLLLMTEYRPSTTFNFTNISYAILSASIPLNHSEDIDVPPPNMLIPFL